VQHFSYYLYGWTFDAYTDHKPLLQLTTSDKLNPRLRRMAYKLQQWLITVRGGVQGEANGFADALSREERSPTQTRRIDLESPSETERELARGDVAGGPTTEEENIEHFN